MSPSAYPRWGALGPGQIQPATGRAPTVRPAGPFQIAEFSVKSGMKEDGPSHVDNYGVKTIWSQCHNLTGMSHHFSGRCIDLIAAALFKLAVHPVQDCIGTRQPPCLPNPGHRALAAHRSRCPTAGVPGGRLRTAPSTDPGFRALVTRSPAQRAQVVHLQCSVPLDHNWGSSSWTIFREFLPEPVTQVSGPLEILQRFKPLLPLT